MNDKQLKKLATSLVERANITMNEADRLTDKNNVIAANRHVTASLLPAYLSAAVAAVLEP